MIVADVNLAVYLLVTGPFTPSARVVLARDPDWVAPAVWRHEFLNVLATLVREGRLAESEAAVAWANGPTFVRDAPSEPEPLDVLRLSVSSRVATYDCLYVTMARQLGIRLVTADKQLLRVFPDVAVGLDAFAAGA